MSAALIDGKHDNRVPSTAAEPAGHRSSLRKTTHVHPTSRGEEESMKSKRIPAWRRTAERFAVFAGTVLLAACGREDATDGENPQIAAAKAAVARKLSTQAPPQYRHIVEYRDGVVCGEVNARKMFSGTDSGFRKFIYNAPEPGELVLDRGDLTPQEISYWCSEQPDKRMRMLASSVAELSQACEAERNDASHMSCRLAAIQKRELGELQAAKGRPANQTAPQPADQATTAATVAARPTPPATPAAPAVAASPPQPTAPAATAATAAAAPAQPATSGNAEEAILAEVGTVLQAWRQRWQEGDVEGYLRMYAPSFTGTAGSRAQWEQQRRQKMKDARPSIRIERLEAVRITPQEVELRFVQVYSARQHRDRGVKTMIFQRSPQGWLIADERWAAAS